MYAPSLFLQASHFFPSKKCKPPVTIKPTYIVAPSTPFRGILDDLQKGKWGKEAKPPPSALFFFSPPITQSGPEIHTRNHKQANKVKEFTSLGVTSPPIQQHLTPYVPQCRRYDLREFRRSIRIPEIFATAREAVSQFVNWSRFRCYCCDFCLFLFAVLFWMIVSLHFSFLACRGVVLGRWYFMYGF